MNNWHGGKDKGNNLIWDRKLTDWRILQGFTSLRATIERFILKRTFLSRSVYH